MPPGIDFLWILVDFGRHVGRKNRTKMEPKSIPKNNENLIGILEASWGDLKRQVGQQGGRAQRQGSSAGGFWGLSLIHFLEESNQDPRPVRGIQTSERQQSKR